MLAIVLVALFAAASAGSVAVLADSAVRGRNAFRQLRGQLARLDTQFETGPRVVVTFVRPFGEPVLPVLRQRAVATKRQAARPAPSRVPIRHAAA